MKKNELIAEIKNLTEIIEERNKFIRKIKADRKWEIIDEFKDNILKIGGSNVNITMETKTSCNGIVRDFKLEFTL